MTTNTKLQLARLSSYGVVAGSIISALLIGGDFARGWLFSTCTIVAYEVLALVALKQAKILGEAARRERIEHAKKAILGMLAQPCSCDICRRVETNARARA